MKEIVILGAARTPIGSFLGTLSSLPAPKLGSVAIKCVLENSRLAPEQIEQVIMGNVLQAAVGQAPARQAGIGAGIPVGAGAVTVNKVCGSGVKAVMYAANDIRCGEYDLAVAGGMESMSNAPYALTQARSGYRMGNSKMIDVMIHDGLWDPYGDKHMGTCAEACVSKYQFSREEQDEYAKESYRRAQDAVRDGKVKNEIAMVAMKDAAIPHQKMNVHGGAVALGHPIGASGARILVTLLHALADRKLKRGMAAICIGGGEAAAMIVERL